MFKRASAVLAATALALGLSAGLTASTANASSAWGGGGGGCQQICVPTYWWGIYTGMTCWCR